MAPEVVQSVGHVRCDAIKMFETSMRWIGLNEAWSTSFFKYYRLKSDSDNTFLLRWLLVLFTGRPEFICACFMSSMTFR